MSISPQDFDYVRSLVCDQAGIVLENGKEYLVESRLVPLAKRHGYDSIDTLLVALRRADATLRRTVVEAMTTNETTFFRDIEPFEALRKHVVPELLAARSASRELRIWYGASSTGQEPYSVVMMLLQHFPQLANWNVTHHATDISLEVLERARQGKYNQIEMNRGLPVAYLVKYFEKCGLEWQLKPVVRDKVRFEQMNLVKPWPALPVFDIVMLRNVMIYFDIEAKKQILGKIRRQLRPDGYLFLGGAETTMGLDDSFRRMQFDRAGCYRTSEAAAGLSMATRGAA
ncbi:MAG: chemotaxis protein CheR [Acidobacteria bacterium RIFCSPLOWO2_12_FULL_67_14b]|nr:MAG: chemotaxis protein CheR [Acidobacteria bacterium RIFCSPLOWO2_12_FULL_67_14b]